MTRLYEEGRPAGMGFPKKHFTDAERRRARLSSQMKCRYGITMDEYDEMFEAQNGLCLICGKAQEDRMGVDHDHGTGAVRGLTCRNCNFGLGFIDRVGLTPIAEYLGYSVVTAP